MASDVTISDGQTSWSAGVDSLKSPVIVSGQNPDGLARNQLAWLINGTVRDGGIRPRPGYKYLGTIHSAAALYQGDYMYEPRDGSNPYFILSISGQIYKVVPDLASMPVNLSLQFGLTNPPNIDQAFFVQGEEFLVIQAGDGITLPLFWDGTTLRRSKGITTPVVAPGTPGINELPAAFSMDYFQGRLWYAQGRQYSAGDIVGGTSGTAAYNFRDAILNVTENPLVLGGDGFTVPSNAGNIRALTHSANLDTTLGQGQLFIGTRKAIYSLNVPVSRNDWIAASNNNQPLQRVVQINNGFVGDRSVVKVNGDLFYQSLEPAIRSLVVATRFFNQWGNREISAPEERILAFADRSLLRLMSGTLSDSRLLQSSMPRQTPQGIVGDSIIPLDFIPISDLMQGEEVPAWEGSWEGLSVLQLSTGDFGGLERSFAVTVSKQDSSIQLWEISDAFLSDFNLTGEERITWVVETPAFAWNKLFELKKLVAGELWIDRLYGEAIVRVEYRQDASSCWHPWIEFKLCQPRTSCEVTPNPVCYPQETFGESYRQTLTLPEPQSKCEFENSRPTNIGYIFQARLTIKGFLRVRGFLLHALPVARELYANLVC